MHRLEELLRRVEDQTTFELGSDHWSSREYREILSGRFLTDRDSQDVRRARTIVPDDLLSEVAELVRTELGEFVHPSTDRIGHAFPIGGEGVHESGTYESDGTVSFEATSQVSTFATSLAEAAALLGTEQSTTLVEGWLQKESIHISQKSILNAPVLIAEPLSLLEGLRIESLPLSTDRLPDNLPRFKDQTPAKYLGRLLLSLEHSATPPLFRPGRERAVRSKRKTEAPGIDADAVCQAFALVTDAFTEVSFSWLDFGVLDAFRFRGGGGGGVWSTSQANFRTYDWPNSSVNNDVLSDVTTLQFDEPAEVAVDNEGFAATLTYLAHRSKKRRPLAIAISRWWSSKDTSRRLEDRFIDLRTALESLYLPKGNNGAITFKVSLNSAWYLGTNLEERKELRKVVRRAYGSASTAVHNGTLDLSSREKWVQENQILLDGQDVVRRGVLRMIKDGKPKDEDWIDIVFGGGAATSVR